MYLVLKGRELERTSMFFDSLFGPWGSWQGELCYWGEAFLPEPSPDLDIEEVSTGRGQVHHPITEARSGFSQLPGLMPPEMSGPSLLGHLKRPA